MKNMMPDDLKCVKVEWENQLQRISKELNELGGQSIPLMWNLPMVLSLVMRSHGTLTWKWGIPIYFATCDSSTQRFVTRGLSISWLNLCPCQRLNLILWTSRTQLFGPRWSNTLRILGCLSYVGCVPSC